MKDGPTETQTKDETMMIDDGGLGLGLLSLAVLSFYPFVSVASLAELVFIGCWGEKSRKLKK